jgi:hypothetical protein
MKRALLTTMSTLVLACLTAITASATSTHYKKFPTCVDNGLTLTCTGALAGLGNFNVLVTLNGQGTVDTECLAPGSGNPSPGQNPAQTVNISGSLLVSASDIKNGNLAFTVSTLVPPTPPPTGPGGAGCANSNWGVRITNVDFTVGTFKLSVLQDINGDGTFDPVTETVISQTPVF